MSEQLDTALGRLGYVRRDNAAAGQALEPRSDNGTAVDPTAAYPQVVMIQGRSAGESWIRDHAGHLLLAAGVGVFGLATLAVVALVAIVVAVALVVVAASVAVIGGVAASQSGGSKRGRR
ncbi:MAG: hypothetical protein ACRDPQ_15730 [Nocardioidaceae bacterium]